MKMPSRKMICNNRKLRWGWRPGGAGSNGRLLETIMKSEQQHGTVRGGRYVKNNSRTCNMIANVESVSSPGWRGRGLFWGGGYLRFYFFTYYSKRYIKCMILTIFKCTIHWC